VGKIFLFARPAQRPISLGEVESMSLTAENLKSAARRRIRNQISNILIFGTLIAFAAAGLVYGAMSGVFLVDHFGRDLAPFLKLTSVVLSTLCGFAAGVGASFYVSPFVLRHAFFAVPIGNWKGISVYACEEADLPGKAPNIFIAGFRRGVGPFRPAIFASRTALSLLERPALEAVFAHELSHLRLGHLRKRLGTAMTTFVTASVLTSAVLLGMQWTGYTAVNGLLSILGGIVPAVLTWMSMKNLLWSQEFEADENAIRVFGAEPGALLEALTSLQTAIGGRTHPLVEARMEKLRALVASEGSIPATRDAFPAERAA
jgi:Zn-dependent protease with chaperone function